MIENAIVVPFRGLKRDKSRLKRDFPEAESEVESIVSLLAERILTILESVRYEKEVFLLTKNPAIRLKGRYHLIIDKGESLNIALANAILHIKAYNYIILMADLPLIKSVNIEHIIELVNSKRKVIIVRAQDKGTSIIAFPSYYKFPFVFGERSSEMFIRNFIKLDIPFQIIEKVSWSIDLDTKKDLREIIKNKNAPQFLVKLQSYD